MVCEGVQDSLIGRLQNTTAKCKQPALAGNRLHFDSTISRFETKNPHLKCTILKALCVGVGKMLVCTKTCFLRSVS
jgi:hypothetical protein